MKISLEEFEDLIENGINIEYPEIAEIIEEYTYNNNYNAIIKVINSKNYGEYLIDVRRLLRKFFPNGIIPVSRIENYLNFDKKNNKKYKSWSIIEDWGKHHKNVIKKNVLINDVIMFGHASEGEIILKN